MDKPKVLSVEGISKRFGGLQAVKDVSIDIAAGERVAIIGPNGAGKSTFVNLITGHTSSDEGTVHFLNRDVTHIAPQRLARLGVGRTFQNLELFASMTALENVLVALERRSSGTDSGIPRNQRRRAAEAALGLFAIGNVRDEKVGSLPYGTRKLVELSRALVTNPPLILLDEPVAGLDETSEYVDILVPVLSDLGCASVLVEHDMKTVRVMADVVHVMDAGRLIASGSFDDVTRDPTVIEAYLGKPHGA